MVTIKCIQAHYQIEDVEMGKVYTWRPESVVIERGCGEKPTPKATEDTCGECGADHRVIVEEELGAGPEEDEEEVDRPWRSPHLYYVPTRGT